MLKIENYKYLIAKITRRTDVDDEDGVKLVTATSV